MTYSNYKKEITFSQHALRNPGIFLCDIKSYRSLGEIHVK
jgi:hypothetical protein